MITLLCFFHHIRIGIELYLRLECETVDASELAILRVSSPICAGELIELPAVFWDLARTEYMRSLTHIYEGRSTEVEAALIVSVILSMRRIHL